MLRGLEDACRALAAGRAVVVPNPSPLAYGVVATSAASVNALKGRPPDQNVAVSLHDRCEWQRVAAIVALPPAVLDALEWLLRQRLSVLVPLRDRDPHPDWVAPAVRDGWLAAFNGHWEATAPVWDGFPRLYGSSANTTGEPPAEFARQAVAMLGADSTVVDADELRGPQQLRMASTMLRIDRDGRLSLHRAGAHDATHPGGPREYLRQLARTAGLAHRRSPWAFTPEERTARK